MTKEYGQVKGERIAFTTNKAETTECPAAKKQIKNPTTHCIEKYSTPFTQINSSES